MGRPKPKILAECSDRKNFKTDQVLEADGIWAIFYQGKPINLRTLSFISPIGPKYKKVSFSNPGHAENLAKKLNEQYKCSAFEVYLLTNGQIIK